MTDDVPWLAQEITDLLDAGQVGVYEFVEAARVELGWYVWPSPDPIRPATTADITDATFEPIGPNPYLGFDRQ